MINELTVAELRKMFVDNKAEINSEIIELLKTDPRKQVRELLAGFQRQQARRQQENSRLRKLFIYERQLWNNNCQLVAGVDEVGRGPLAGPVMAAAVVLPGEVQLPGLNDSKQLTPRQREELEVRIKAVAISWSLGLASPQEIDQMNIRVASLLAMRRAVENLDVAPEHLLVDAVQIPGVFQAQTAIIKGDRLSASIAAASIIAKVERDRLMDFYDVLFPGYGFAKHKGYPTPEHFRALASLGPCSIHRRTFAPVRDLLMEDHYAASLFYSGSPDSTAVNCS
ncbi:MAG: ribonuclease HII [Firmicutes bacterium]|nr:ribonuclease HII [Bacillota bacterium]